MSWLSTDENVLENNEKRHLPRSIWVTFSKIDRDSVRFICVYFSSMPGILLDIKLKPLKQIQVNLYSFCCWYKSFESISICFASKNVVLSIYSLLFQAKAKQLSKIFRDYFFVSFIKIVNSNRMNDFRSFIDFSEDTS